MWKFSELLLCAVMLALAGCVTPPSTSIHQPLTARAAEQAPRPSHNGAIFQAGRNERPLFEDRRARNVGDVLTINIVESTSASGKSSASAEHSGSVSATTPTGGNSLFQTLLKPVGISGGAKSDMANKSASAGSNVFTGVITVTVIDVLPNGNLLVGGEKQVAINHDSEYIRFSGVVNPATISGANTVQSTQVADAHVEYKDASGIDRSALMSMLARVFLSVLPF